MPTTDSDTMPPAAQHGRRRRQGERGDRAVERGERHQQPDGGRAGQHDRRHRGLGQQRQQARHHQHHPARHAVGQHAAEQQQQHVRQGPGAYHEPQVLCGPREVEDGERERDGRQRVARHRHDPAAGQVAEGPVAKRRPRVHVASTVDWSISKSAIVAPTKIVPSVRGGRAARCRSSEAAGPFGGGGHKGSNQVLAL
jgi:hypothetical protein